LFNDYISGWSKEPHSISDVVLLGIVSLLVKGDATLVPIRFITLWTHTLVEIDSIQKVMLPNR
jgi:hypothetical protein